MRVLVTVVVLMECVGLDRVSLWTRLLLLWGWMRLELGVALRVNCREEVLLLLHLLMVMTLMMTVCEMISVVADGRYRIIHTTAPVRSVRVIMTIVIATVTVVVIVVVATVVV